MGQFVVPLSLAFVAAPLPSERLNDKIGARTPAALGMILVALYALSSFVHSPGHLTRLSSGV
ncbi:MAG: hypothetical protein M0T85_05945 [Dehalococcoidales bacterium]|nr:hypothetical protein [Dehalococcoidales bacterium]